MGSDYKEDFVRKYVIAYKSGAPTYKFHENVPFSPTVCSLT